MLVTLLESENRVALGEKALKGKEIIYVSLPLASCETKEECGPGFLVVTSQG